MRHNYSHVHLGCSDSYATYSISELERSCSYFEEHSGPVESNKRESSAGERGKLMRKISK
jgi:hypothetical protein